MTNLPPLATSPRGTMRLDNGTRVMLAASARENTIGLGVVAGPPSKVASHYQIDLLIDALEMARDLSGDPPETVKVMFSAASDDDRRCLILCVENTDTAMIVAPCRPAYRTDGDEEEEEHDNDERKESPRLKRYRYIGPEDRVSPCKWHLNPDAIDRYCREGICPGHIDGKCPLYGSGDDTGVFDFAKDFFEVVDDARVEEGDDD